MEIATIAVREALLMNIKKEHIGDVIQKAHIEGLEVAVSNSHVLDRTNIHVSFGPMFRSAVESEPDIRIWSLLQWALDKEIVA